MKESIGILKDEHRSISAVLLGLKHLADMAQDARVRPDFQVFRSMLRYIDEYPGAPAPSEGRRAPLRAAGAARARGAKSWSAELQAEHAQGAQPDPRAGAQADVLRGGLAGRRRRFPARWTPMPTSTGSTCARKRRNSCRSPNGISPWRTGARSTPPSRATAIRSPASRTRLPEALLAHRQPCARADRPGRPLEEAV